MSHRFRPQFDAGGLDPSRNDSYYCCAGEATEGVNEAVRTPTRSFEPFVERKSTPENIHQKIVVVMLSQCIATRRRQKLSNPMTRKPCDWLQTCEALCRRDHRSQLHKRNANPIRFKDNLGIRRQSVHRESSFQKSKWAPLMQGLFWSLRRVSDITFCMRHRNTKWMTD